MALDETPGWQTLVAASGAEGLAGAREGHPDAILLDVMMPDLDGLAVLAALKADPVTSAIPVIMLTAKVQAARRPPALASGVIVKPFDPLRLGSQVARILGWPAPASAPPDAGGDGS